LATVDNAGEYEYDAAISFAGQQLEPAERHKPLQTSSRTRVFISYSHKDKSHLKRLQVHLEPYRRVGMDIWDDTKIAIGQQWRQEIEHAIAATKVAILLVSADFLASKFIADNELPPLLAAAETDGAKIISVIVGACNFADSELSHFQAANPPSNPLNKMPPPIREEVWRDVARLVKNSLN
jgi:TIR domain